MPAALALSMKRYITPVFLCLLLATPGCVSQSESIHKGYQSPVSESRLTDSAVCKYALDERTDVLRWSTVPWRQEYRETALHRGLSLERCGSLSNHLSTKSARPRIENVPSQSANAEKQQALPPPILKHPRPALAAGELTIDPFNQKALKALNWKNFPTKKHLRHFKVYSGKQRENAKWKFIYEREFLSEFGKTTENIQSFIKNGKNIFRIVIYFGDNSISKKCDKARINLKRAIGKPSVFVDTSYTSKILLSNKSKETFDFSYFIVKMHNFVRNTSITMNCLGFNADLKKAASQSFSTLLIEPKGTAKLIKPISWLVCSVQSRTRYFDGTEKLRDEEEWVLGVDFNGNNILRADNSPIDQKANINDSSINFKIGKKNPISLGISRYTGSITGEMKVSIRSRSTAVSFTGSCKKFDKSKKKF